MEKNNQQQIKAIDRLFQNIGEYRNSKEFERKLKFYSRFHYLGVFNAALVEEQLPGARFVATLETWKKKYHRRVIPDSQPVVVLMPFGPVEFMFDISKTEPLPSDKPIPSDEDIIESIKLQFSAEPTPGTRQALGYLSLNLPKYGVLMKKMNSGSELAAKIAYVDRDQLSKMPIQINKELSTTYQNYFTISINSDADEPTLLASAFHELGHLFCHHLPSPNTPKEWWKVRKLDTQAEEFEAEIVSYLVCERMGIKTKSEQYLAGYVDKNDHIPNISMSKIFDAVDEIEKIIGSSLYVESCLLCKNDEDFKGKMKEIRKQQKAKKEAKKNRF